MLRESYQCHWFPFMMMEILFLISCSREQEDLRDPSKPARVSLSDRRNRNAPAGVRPPGPVDTRRSRTTVGRVWTTVRWITIERDPLLDVARSQGGSEQLLRALSEGTVNGVGDGIASRGRARAYLSSPLKEYVARGTR